MEYESSLERELFTICELHPRVISFEAQPITIHYGGPGRAKRYTPDALVRLRPNTLAPGGRNVLVEVKTRDDLFKNITEYSEKFAEARAFSMRRGWTFRIVTERHLRGPYGRNAGFLLPFTRAATDEINERPILRHLEIVKASPVRDVISALSTTETEQLLLLSSLWRLVAAGKLACDLSKDLSPESVVYIPHRCVP